MNEEMRAAILAADDLPREPVDVPWELGGAKLYVRGLTSKEKDAWVARSSPNGEFRWTRNLTADLVVATLVDETGARIFTDDDAEALGEKDGQTMTELFNVAMRLSGLTEEAAEAVEADLGTTQSAPSAIG
jgi:hypothetical protein